MSCHTDECYNLYLKKYIVFKNLPIHHSVFAIVFTKKPCWLLASSNSATVYIKVCILKLGLTLSILTLSFQINRAHSKKNISYSNVKKLQ